MISSNGDGMTVAGCLAWLVAPLVRRDAKFLLLWTTSAFSVVLVSVLNRRPWPNHHLPGVVLGFTLACTASLWLVERKGPVRILGACWTVAILACAPSSTSQIVSQALRVPTRSRVAEAVRRIYRPARDKILASQPDGLGLPIEQAAKDEERQRHERLAKKYGVLLLPRPEERKSSRDETVRAFYIRAIPWVMGGLEDQRPEDVKIVKPYFWPIQYAEWDLDYWVRRGFNLFILTNIDKIEQHPVASYRSFVKQIKERCELVETIPSSRPLFEDCAMEIRIYRLRGQPDP